jgi:hypothetical protein
MMANQVIYIVIILLLSGCQANGQLQDKGQALITSYYYSKKSGKLMDSICFRVWWDGNQSILQVPLIRFEEDAAGNRKDWVEINHYSFLDPQKNVCYNYKSFTDTAKVLKAYSDIDSVEVDGGWNYLSKEGLRFETASRLSDTTINGENFQRLYAHRKDGEYLIDFFMYMNCDVKAGNVKLHKHLSDSLGCPIVRNDTYINDRLYSSLRFTFVSDRLTEEEIKVFEAWRKNVNSALP